MANRFTGPWVSAADPVRALPHVPHAIGMHGGKRCRKALQCMARATSNMTAVLPGAHAPGKCLALLAACMQDAWVAFAA